MSQLGMFDKIFSFAKNSPSLIAVEDRGQPHTYEDLAHRSMDVAHALSSALNGSRNVSLFLDRSHDAIATILATAINGGCFCPIDVNLPGKRISSILDHFEPSVIVTTAALREKILPLVQGRSDVQLLFVDEINGLEDYDLNSNSIPKDVYNEEPLYVYYTSGSTGTPKAIAGKLSGLEHFIEWETGHFKTDETTRVSHLTNLSFDPALRDVFVPLTSGGTCCIPDQSAILDPERFGAWVKNSRVNLMHIVPTIFKSWTAALEEGARLDDLKDVLLAGELLRSNDVKRFVEKTPSDVRLTNMYGPTETTLAKFFHHITAEDLNRPLLPVGQPINGARAVIVDENGEPVKAGEIGEVSIQTLHASFGYYKNPELTQKMFVLPSEGSENGVVYKTGDLGRDLGNGSYELVGRKDKQVKILGHRIEIGEIEEAILKVDGVNNVAVISREFSSGSSGLLAYFTPNTPELKDLIISWLKNDLPAYMIPADAIALDKLPQLPNGKIDRTALAERIWLPQQSEQAKVWANDNEEALAKIVENIIGLPASSVSAQDNFIRLGGDSMRAGELIYKVRKVFGKEIGFNDLMQSENIHALHLKIERAQDSTVSEAITPVSGNSAAPLSRAQRRIYFASLINTENNAYLETRSLRISGSIDAERLSQAWTQLAQRHSALRTQIEQKDGSPVQKIMPVENFPPISVEDMTSGDKASREHIVKEPAEPFALEDDYLCRLRLLKLADNEHVLRLEFHHLLLDGHSVDLIQTQLADLYGGRADFSNALLQQVDAAAVESVETKSSPQFEGLRNRWKERFSTTVEPLMLPFDHPGQGTPMGPAGTIAVDVPKETYQAIKELAQKNNATLFMAYTAAMNMLLYRYTGANDIVIGTPGLDRPQPEMLDTVGCFVNMLPIRSKVSADQTYVQALQQAKEVSSAAYQDQHYPFDWLVSDLNLANQLERHPLFDTVVLYEKEKPNLNGESKFGDAFVEREAIEPEAAKFMLTLRMEEVNDNLRAVFEYRSDLFDAGTIKRMSQHLLNLLGEVAKNPDNRLSDLDILTAGEKQELSTKLDFVDVNWPQEETIESLFMKQVKENPDKVAIVSEEGNWTYGRLAERSEVIARKLKQAGVQSGDRVALLLDRDPAMIAVVLGVVRAGAGYVPIEPDIPEDRISYILENSAPRVILTAGDHGDNRGTLTTTVIRLDDIIDAPVDDTLPALSPNQPDNLAYVIYTSGTTGKPKGVMIEHQNVVRLLFNDKDLFDFGDKDVWSLFHSYSFDFSVWEMYGPLLKGGSVAIVPKPVTRDPLAFHDFLAKNKVTILNQTPSAFYNLSNTDQTLPETDLSIRKVIFGGEALSPGKLRHWMDRYPDTKMINMFGITETTVHVTYKEITDREIETNVSNIGMPIPTMGIYIVDKEMNLVPPGVVGEILVAGAGVGRGYLNRDDLTRSRFIPDPFRPGQRAYRSGDLARFLANGELEYLGRMDNQIQLRGFRVELGEIESTLRQHPDVLDAVAAAQVDNKGDPYICAFVKAATEITSVQLREHLKKHLPHYMIPSDFRYVENFQLTGNGKTDIRALLAQAKRIDATHNITVPPRNKAEKRLAAIWMDALETDQAVGVQDDFFDLGGNSIKALRIVSALKGQISLADIYQSPTIEDQAALLENARKATALSSLHVAKNKSTTVICVPYAGGDVSDYMSLVRSASKLRKDLSFYGVNWPGTGFARGFRELTSIKEIATEVVKEIAGQIDTPIYLYGHCVGSSIAFEIARQLEKEGKQVLGVMTGGVVFPEVDIREEAKDPWAGIENAALIKEIKGMGGFKDVPEGDVLQEILTNFRNDVKAYRFDLHATLKDMENIKIKAPMTCVYGTADVSTPNFQQEHHRWNMISDNPEKVVLDGVDHYFVKNDANLLSKVLVQKIERALATHSADIPAPDRPDNKVVNTQETTDLSCK